MKIDREMCAYLKDSKNDLKELWANEKEDKLSINDFTKGQLQNINGAYERGVFSGSTENQSYEGPKRAARYEFLKEIIDAESANHKWYHWITSPIKSFQLARAKANLNNGIVSNNVNKQTMESIKEAFENDDSTPNELNFDGEKITKDLSNNERTLLDSDQLDLGEDVEINDDDLILDDADQAIMEAEASDDFQM